MRPEDLVSRSEGETTCRSALSPRPAGLPPYGLASQRSWYLDHVLRCIHEQVDAIDEGRRAKKEFNSLRDLGGSKQHPQRAALFGLGDNVRSDAGQQTRMNHRRRDTMRCDTERRILDRPRLRERTEICFARDVFG